MSTLEQVIGHRFRDPGLAEEAFLHDSFLHENPGSPLRSNERLEFVGDAWLGYVVAVELFRRYPDASEGFLTKFRAALVQRSTLAAIAGRLGLGQFLQMGQGELKTGGRQRPSILAGLYEAVVGALVIDGGEGAARDFVLRTLGPLLDDPAGGPQDFKSELQEYCQARRWDAPVYRLASAEGPPHDRQFSVEVIIDGSVRGRGAGPSRREAEKEAAREALRDYIESLPGKGDAPC